MSVIFGAPYALPALDYPLTHARIAHSGNWLSGGTVAASSTDPAYFADAPDESPTYEKWKPASIPATWEYSHGSAAEVDYCCIAAHTLGSDGATFTVQYHNGSTWVSVTPSSTVTDDQSVFAIFEPVTAQRWRVNITASTSIPNIGVIRFGKAMQMPRPLYQGHNPLDLSRDTTTRTNGSVGGEWLGRSVERTAFSTTYQWSNIQAQWVRDNWSDFQRQTEVEAFFIAWRPTSFGEVGYCYIEGHEPPANTGPKALMSVSLNVQGYGYD